MSTEGSVETWISKKRFSPIPKTSKPGPMLALDAGTFKLNLDMDLGWIWFGEDFGIHKKLA